MAYSDSKMVSMAVAASAAIFMMVGCESSGTTAGSRVEGANPSAQQGTPQAALVIPICTADAGNEPWTTDGTAAGSFMLKDINEGPNGSVSRRMGGDGYNNKFVVMGLDTYFSARMQHTNDDNSTYETIALWKSDGTTAGTVMLKDFGSSRKYMLEEMAVMGGHLYFIGWDEEHGDQVWKTDGTVEGTVRVTAFERVSSIGRLRALADVVTFRADTGEDVTYLYKTDGTWSENEMDNMLTSDNNGFSPSKMKVVDGKLYFMAKDEEHGYEPWVSDGTKAGTRMIADIKVGGSGSYPSGFTGYNGYVYFKASGDVNGTSIGPELFRTDGTATGTTLVKDIVTGSEGSAPSNFTVWKDALYFSIAKPDVYDYKYFYISIWKTDGTYEGTKEVFEDVGGENDTLMTLNDKLLFKVYNEENSTLYAYDGSVGEDGNATDPVVVYASDSLNNFKLVENTVYGDILLFIANDENNDTDGVTALYGTDGTKNGTIELKGNLCPNIK